MRVIFLDFDGVLNSAEWMKHLHNTKEKFDSFLQRSYKELDPIKVKMMSEFAIEQQASIVVSSSWRILHPLHELCDILLHNGMTEEALPKAVTPHFGNFRGDEVNLWLQQNPQYNSHVIFDDDGDFHKDQPLVKTTWETGLQEAHIDLARGIFRG